jgi:hypothetical protein
MKKKQIKTEGTVKREDLDGLTRKMTQMPRIKLKDLKKKKPPSKG